jgi:hypothetical protein
MKELVYRDGWGDSRLEYVSGACALAGPAMLGKWVKDMRGFLGCIRRTGEKEINDQGARWSVPVYSLVGHYDCRPMVGGEIYSLLAKEPCKEDEPFKLTKPQKKLLKDKDWDTDIVEGKEECLWLELDAIDDASAYADLCRVSKGVSSRRVHILVVAISEQEDTLRHYLLRNRMGS